MHIRILQEADATMYREFRARTLKESPEAFLTLYDEYMTRPLTRIARQLSPEDNKFTVGAFVSDGTLVGAATLFRQSGPKLQHTAEITAMFVAPEWRHQGVGEAVLASAIDQAKLLPGLEQLKLSVVQSNTAAIRLYERCGFRIYGQEIRAVKYENRYWDEIHMVLQLGTFKEPAARIRELSPAESAPMELLLTADPSERLVSGYLKRGQCFVAEVNGAVVGVCVLIETRPDTLELVNLAVHENYQRRGIGRQLVLYAIEAATQEGYQTLELGTGNSSIHQLLLYQRCGFRIVGIDHDFFVMHYTEPIYENGLQCRDMIRLRLDLATNK